MTASFVNEDDRRETIAEPGQVTCRPSSGLVPILCAHRCRNQAIRLTENCPSEGAARTVVVRKYERAARRRQGSLRLLDLPRRLKPIPKRSGYRSAEALRHPKSAASKICCLRNLLACKIRAESNFPSHCQKLFCRHQRMRNGMDGERDAVLHSYFAHEFGYVRFYGALFYAKG